MSRNLGVRSGPSLCDPHACDLHSPVHCAIHRAGRDWRKLVFLGISWVPNLNGPILSIRVCSIVWPTVQPVCKTIRQWALTRPYTHAPINGPARRAANLHVSRRANLPKRATTVSFSIYLRQGVQGMTAKGALSTDAFSSLRCAYSAATRER